MNEPSRSGLDSRPPKRSLLWLVVVAPFAILAIFGVIVELVEASR
jgi:hypothetical protein